MFELAVKFPIHNEEKSIIGVLNEWIVELDKLKIDYCLVISEDGSNDKTKSVLSEFILKNKRAINNPPISKLPKAPSIRAAPP